MTPPLPPPRHAPPPPLGAASETRAHAAAYRTPAVRTQPRQSAPSRARGRRADGRDPAAPIRRRYHFHTPGFVYILITVLIALGAFNSQNNLLFWAFGFALAVLIVSGLISGQMLMGIRAVREPAGSAPGGGGTSARAIAGEPVDLVYRVTNRSRFVPAFAIGAGELPRMEPFAAAPTTAIPAPYAFLVHAGPGETVEARATFTPPRRGVLRLDTFQLDTTFPFGLIRKSLLFEQPRTILVRPSPLPAPPDLFRRRPVGDRGGQPRPARAGHGEDFFALRDYVPGDSPRTIAWRASARADELVVRQHTQPSPRRITVIVHADERSPAADAEAAIARAAGVIIAAAERGYEVGLIVPAAGLVRRPLPGPAAAGRLLDDLALLDLSAAAGARAPIPRAAPRGELVVAVHAGRPDPSLGPAGAVHLAGPDAAEPSQAPAPTPAHPPAHAHAGSPAA